MTGIISRLETLQGIAGTHRLESQEQASLVGLTPSKALQALTYWIANDKLHQ